jgi:hypothetical protein
VYKRQTQELARLPRGSFILRIIRGRKYGYLTYREGNKVKQKYLGAMSRESIDHFKSLALKKKSLKEKLKSVRAQKNILERALRGKAK